MRPLSLGERAGRAREAPAALRPLPKESQEPMRVATSVVASLFANIVAGVYDVISGAIDWKEGAREIIASLAALAVAVLLLRALIWLAGNLLVQIINHVCRVALT